MRGFRRNPHDRGRRNKSARHHDAEKRVDPLRLALSLSWDRWRVIDSDSSAASGSTTRSRGPDRPSATRPCEIRGKKCLHTSLHRSFRPCCLFAIQSSVCHRLVYGSKLKSLLRISNRSNLEESREDCTRQKARDCPAKRDCRSRVQKNICREKLPFLQIAEDAIANRYYLYNCRKLSAKTNRSIEPESRRCDRWSRGDSGLTRW